MPRKTRTRKPPKGARPGASKDVRPSEESQAAHIDDDPREEPERGTSSLTLEATSATTQALAVRSDIGRTGHKFLGSVTKGNANAHFGDVYNIHHTPTAVPDDKDGGVDVMKALAFEGMSIRLATVRPAYAETCKWMLDRQEYLDWRNPDFRNLHHGVLWIKGNPGAGKSTLMRCIHDHAIRQHRDEVVVSFFFSARSLEPLAKSTEGMYRSVLYQMFGSIPRLKSGLPQSHITKSEQPFWTLELLEDALRDAILALDPTESVTLYIDALDECEVDDVRRALGFFEDIMECATNGDIRFLVCVSSRYYPQIRMQHHAEVRLDKEPEHMRDIAQYIESKLVVPKAIKDRLLPEICERSSWGFLWAVLVVKKLREKSDTGSTRSDLLAMLSSVPSELGDLFTSLMKDADSGLIAIMQWVLFSRRGMKGSELYLPCK